MSHLTFVYHLLKFKDFFFHVDSIKRQRKMRNFLCLSRRISCTLIILFSHFFIKSILLFCVLHSHPFHFSHIIEIEFLVKELLSSTICTPVNQSVVEIISILLFFYQKMCEEIYFLLILFIFIRRSLFEFIRVKQKFFLCSSVARFFVVPFVPLLHKI